MSVFVVSSSHYQYSCYLAVNSGFFPVEITTISENRWQVCGELYFLYGFIVLFKFSCLVALGGTLSRTSSDNYFTSSPRLISECSALQVLQAWLLSDAMYVIHPWRQVKVLTILFFFKWQKSRNTEEAPQSKHLELWWKRKHTYYSVMKTLIGNVPTCRLRDTKMFQNNILLSNMIYKNHSSQSYRQNYMHKVIWIHFELTVGN